VQQSHRAAMIALGAGGSFENGSAPAAGPTESADHVKRLVISSGESSTKNLPTLGILQRRVSRERGAISYELR